MSVHLYRVAITCTTCGETVNTHVSADYAQTPEGRALLDAEYARHTETCVMRNA